jgi:A/G-specific adenine glycosylase
MGAEADARKTAWMRERLLAWWRQNRREFPWRATGDPYRILIAEMMLRKTQAKQVVPVYLRFLTDFPDAESFGHASRRRIREILKPLGLNWRAEDFIRLASLIRTRGAQVLRDPDTIGSLPGAGDYVAAAVRCLAFGQQVPMIDTNTSRVIARFYGVRSQGEPRRSRPIRGLAASLVACTDAARINLALIDLAATLCRPREPLCHLCPLSYECDEARTRAAPEDKAGPYGPSRFEPQRS